MLHPLVLNLSDSCPTRGAFLYIIAISNISKYYTTVQLCYMAMICVCVIKMLNANNCAIKLVVLNNF